MTCTKCGNDAKAKDRPDGRCPKCGQAFVFNPQNGDRFTDAAFQRALARVSSEGQVRFHPEHLRQELRRRRTSSVGWTVLRIMSAAIFIGSAVVGVFAITFVAGALFAVGQLGAWRAGRASAPDVDVVPLLGRWALVHGPPKGLLAASATAPRLTATLEAELEEYSFDRAVVTDSPRVVDVLVANNFHFENNCAVLTVDGYPATTFELIRRMLRRNPNVLVLVVHSATPEGCRLATRLKEDPDWFRDRGKVVDVGLRPAHAKFFPRLTGPGDPSATAGGGVTVTEARWLRQHSLAIEVVRPEQLIKRLFRAMTAVESGAWDGGSGGVIYFGSEAGTSDGGGDSFG